MANEINIRRGIDWVTVLLYLSLVLIGYFNIYAAVYNPENPIAIFSLDHSAGRQLMFLGLATILVTFILFIDYKVYDSFAYIFYGFMILLLIATIFLGSDIKGSKSWIKLGSFSLQPAEFAKLVTALALSKYLSSQTVNLKRFSDLWKAAALILIPPVIIILQKETGSALTFAIFLVVLYREGLPGIYPALSLAFVVLLILSLLYSKWYILIGLVVLAVIFYYFILAKRDRKRQNVIRIAGIVLLFSTFTMGVDFFVNKVLQPHQQKRIKILVDPDADPLGAGWNVTQSKIAIGSGGFTGKGYLKGTQTKFDFVPEQSTDFIFCTIGEEWGFMGSLVLIGLYLAFLARILYLAELQRDKFARVYGYCVASIIFFHLLVNIGMTIGLMPVIGIPLPLVSYGGSSLWSFTILIFVFLKLDAHRSYKV
ncbi:rod shape-determining protein RodA [Jiulongibacter sediminis]|uniref:Cell wall polymerase n=1 Tax=Jiulongibacter sediminis TaxID=1605367 RepID=A0A0P7C1J2_9BACT|nr:rod shape-determining protein RodA [Jiulongibacter sediminis]KPM47193.1 rod shape-determining protein RodA [Jiulongibacter sediminis]TBX22751.1 rod shape-determining protein RodA [Jiulongibacter sediminis]